MVQSSSLMLTICVRVILGLNWALMMITKVFQGGNYIWPGAHKKNTSSHRRKPTVYLFLIIRPSLLRLMINGYNRRLLLHFHRFILWSWSILGRSQWSSFTLMDLMDQICSFSSFVLAVNKTIVVCTALNTFLSLSLTWDPMGVEISKRYSSYSYCFFLPTFF